MTWSRGDEPGKVHVREDGVWRQEGPGWRSGRMGPTASLEGSPVWSLIPGSH